ncbi:MAG: DUF3857 and transglutaminase domain-containing protein [Candidatus Krumholzibacteriota bacterium]|nr:DUF3857 and transglutaminase domain-containing protein [Candidatus Krumholzibacteriota bacterium]
MIISWLTKQDRPRTVGGRPGGSESRPFPAAPPRSGKPFPLLLACCLGAVAIILFSGPAWAQTEAEVWEMLAGTGGPADYPEASCLVVLDKTDIEVEESGLSHIRKYELFKIITEQGAREEAVRRFDYDPASNFIRVESIKIFRKGGSVEMVDLEATRDLFAPARAIYWGARMKTIGLPRLWVGDAVEIRTYKKGFEIAYLAENGEPDESRYVPPMRGHFYDSVIFQGDHPLAEKRYQLHLPVDKDIQYQVYNGTIFSARKSDEKRIHYSWWLKDIPALKREPRMAALSDIAPKLVLATVSSWQEKSRWFDAIHDTIFDDNEEIRAKVKEVTQGLKKDLDKVAALLHWSAQEIRYSGISMGKGEGYTIHPGWMIFADRCGVCKDKAGMLITMMRSAGYEVYPALTMAGSRVEDVPADQFNHSVVAWRREDGTYTMLDPTWVVNSTELWSSAEQEQNFVIGTPWGEGLMKTPYSPPENHVLRIVSRADIDGEGNLSGRLEIEGTNYLDQRMRRYLGNHRRDDREAFLEGWLSSISPAVYLEEYSIGDPLDFAHPFVLRLKYRIPAYAVVLENSLDFSSPAWSLACGNRYLFSASTEVGLETRSQPLFIWFTQTLDCEETVRLPKGFSPRSPGAAVKEDERYASFEAGRTFRGRVLENGGRVLVKNRLIPVGDYPRFRKVIKKVEEYAGERIVVKK